MFGNNVTLTWKWPWNDQRKEIHHPLLIVLAIMFGFLYFVLIVLSFPLDLVLKAIGRQGFIRHESNGLKLNLTMAFDKEAFTTK